MGNLTDSTVMNNGEEGHINDVNLKNDGVCNVWFHSMNYVLKMNNWEK